MNIWQLSEEHLLFCQMGGKLVLIDAYAKPEGQSTTCLHVGECKGQEYSFFFK